MSQAPNLLNLSIFPEDAPPGPGLGLLRHQHLEPEGEAGGGEDSVLLLQPPGQPGHPAPAVPDADWRAENTWERSAGAVSHPEDEPEQLPLHLILELHLVPAESQTRQVRGGDTIILFVYHDNNCCKIIRACQF